MDDSWQENAQVSSLVTCMSGDTNVFVSGLWNLWQELGYVDDVCMERLATARRHLSELMSEMKSEETHAVESLRDLTNILTDECKDLAKELEVVHTVPTGAKLLAYHNAIKKQRDDMRVERGRRLKEYDILVNEERRLCNCMRLEATRFSPKSASSRKRHVPSQDQLEKLSRNVVDLQTKEMTRKNQFLASRTEIFGFCEQLDCALTETSQEDFVQAVASSDVAKFVLSIENMKALEVLRKKLSDKVAQLAQTGKALESQIITLWADLSMEQDQELLDRYSSYSGRDINALEAILTALHAEKMSHLKEVIENVRKSISQLHDKLSFGTQQQGQFKLMFIDEFSCETLEAHQAERRRLQAELDENDGLYRLVQRRENGWKMKVQYELSAGDFNRFSNRGGQLLKEQKAQQKLDRELPKLESELNVLIKSWEHRMCRQFVAFDDVYTQRMATQCSELTASKEEKKQKRKEQKLANIEEERLHGSRPPPTTPLKKRIVMTPTSARTKSRIDSSLMNVSASQRVLHSSLKAAYSKSPCSSASTTNTSIVSTSRQASSGLAATNRVTRSMAARQQRVPMTDRNSSSVRQPSHLVTGGKTVGTKKQQTRVCSSAATAARTATTTTTTTASSSSLASCADENNPNVSMSNVSYAAFKMGLALGPGGSVDTSHCCATSVGRTTFV